MKMHNFGNNRVFAAAFAWHEAQQGARVTMARRATGWTVTVREA